MKKIFLCVVVLIISSLLSYAQKDVTKFLGIPVDGTKSEMIRKLKAKGYTSSEYDNDILVGEFNGIDVNIHVVTNNNKVYRIMVCDKNTRDESSIKIRFNNLCRQFQNNKRYEEAKSDNRIPEDENISYEISVNKKRYEADYYQLPTALDTVALATKVRAALLEKYTEEQLSNPTEELQKEMLSTTFSHLMDVYLKKSVWFIISTHAGEYYITMYYDNEYNSANGEDL